MQHCFSYSESARGGFWNLMRKSCSEVEGSLYRFFLLLSVLRSADHLEHFLICVYELQIYAGMTTRENVENFVRKRLPNLIDILEIKDHRAESVDAQQKALRLRPGNQIIRALLRHFHR